MVGHDLDSCNRNGPWNQFLNLILNDSDKTIKIKEFYEQYEHIAPALFFFGGFLLDVFTLGRVDDGLNIVTLTFYLVISLYTFVLEIKEVKLTETSSKLKTLILTYRDEIFHFGQGALLSAFTLFYFKSASLSTSLIFLLFMVSLLLLNELPAFQKLGHLIKGILINLSLLSFCLVYIPQIGGKVGTLMFILSLSIYALLLALFLWAFLKIKCPLPSLKRSWLIPGVSLAFFIFVMRLLNLMPPVPLSLETAGVYHKVVKDYPRYELHHERPWWRFWHTSDELFSARPGDKVFFFARIFAPGGFEDQVFVHWQTYKSGDWLTSDKIPLSILGGREKGFRGYAYKQNYTPGLWRVLVETTSGLEIGRLEFEILSSNETKERNFTVITDSD
ncbi:MAG: DUF2914 domain-containing protein [Bdellovibrionota bacterium]|nr:DUF2914 domain-containing protein [Bdellovibrionota bacterium]